MKHTTLVTSLLTTGTMGLAGLVAGGLLALPGASVASATPGKDAFVKREEHQSELALVADDNDDDDTGRASRDTRSRNTSASRSTRDHTRSNFTKASRDRDLSRSDKTRDWTGDGKGKEKRDWSQNRTNDRSRNDTR